MTHNYSPSFLRTEEELRIRAAEADLIIATRKSLALKRDWPTCECGLPKRINNIRVGCDAEIVVVSYVCATDRCVPVLDLWITRVPEKATEPFHMGAVIIVG